MMMSLETFDQHCASLLGSHMVVQWGGAHVWKIGEKVFAIGGWSKEEHPYITFKCTPISFNILKEQSGLRPAPYLAPRGGKWIQMFALPGLSDADLRAYLTNSYELVAASLTRKKQREIGLAVN